MTATGLVLAASPNTISISALTCDCEPDIRYKASLPRSHPSNQCALQDQAQQTGWLQWVQGSSRSVSFHFLDLLELLSQYSERANHEEKSSQPSTN